MVLIYFLKNRFWFNNIEESGKFVTTVAIQHLTDKAVPNAQGIIC
ncbi:MAG: hypothetical protein ACI96W_002684 [Paraglaciecola sp.]|jgi:hypothetical protein